MTCDVVPMDCTGIIFGIPFLYDRKDTIILYQGKYMVSKGDEPFIIHIISIQIESSLLVNKAQAKRLMQSSQKFILIMVIGHRESHVET